MIITPDEANRLSDSKQAQAPVGPEEPPPSYAHSESIASGSARPPFKTKPTNFLALYDDDKPIRGEFVIDPALCIPSGMLPPLGADEADADRRNLRLRSKASSVHAEIWLLGPAPGLASALGSGSASKPLVRRTTIALTSDHGSIHAQLHTLDGAAPCSLTARASHGSVRLAIPRSFQGLLALSTRHGSVALTDALVEDATQLSTLGTTRRYFVGDFEALREDTWEGDQVEVEAPHGSIRVRYVDEGAETQGRRGLLSRLFGK